MPIGLPLSQCRRHAEHAPVPIRTLPACWPGKQEVPEPCGPGTLLIICGAEGTRTLNPLDATEVRYQLRYCPAAQVPPSGLETLAPDPGRRRTGPRVGPAMVRIAPEDIRKKGKVPKNGSLFFTIFQTFMASAGSATEEENYFEVLEVNTPSFRFSECHPSKRGELYVLRFIEQLECHPLKEGN